LPLTHAKITLVGATSPRRDQRCEGEIELAGADGRDVRVGLGFIDQPGGDQLGADLAHRRDLLAVAHRPADRETARRRDVDQARLAQVFRPDGTVTAANACPLNDGAAALVIMSNTPAAELGLTALTRIVATGISALSPEIMGLGPVEASRRALSNAGMTLDDIDLVEIKEAFAAQAIPSARELGIDPDKLNVNGHPFGMTGARITSTLINSLQFHDKQFGLETMCVGGGQGMAMVIERLS
jgi:acetyl-CoA acetyltransferase family protein